MRVSERARATEHITHTMSRLISGYQVKYNRYLIEFGSFCLNQIKRALNKNNYTNFLGYYKMRDGMQSGSVQYKAVESINSKENDYSENLNSHQKHHVMLSINQ